MAPLASISLFAVASTEFIPRTLSWLDYTTLALYFTVNLLIGWWCARRKKAQADDYFLGGGRVAWWAAAISFFCTATSSISFMALPASSFKGNWMEFGSAPAQAFAGILVGLVFVGILRRMDMTTIFAYLERRFGKGTQLVGAALSVMLKVGGRMSVVLLLPALALSVVTGLNVYLSIIVMGVVTTIYAMEGGFEAVIWTDVMQAGVMSGGIIIAIIYLANGVDGGLRGIIGTAVAAGKFKAVSLDFNFTDATAWVFAGMFFGHIFTQLGDQPLMQRMLATADEKEARRTVVLGNTIGLASSVVFFFVGTALWAFYNNNPGHLAPGLQMDKIFPYFIANELPHGVVGLIVAGLFAVSMGALSGIINSVAAIVVSDFQKTFRPQSTEAQRVRLAKMTTCLCGLLATAFAVYLAYLDLESLWKTFLRLTALIGGGFPGVFALGLLTRRANARGAVTGAIASVFVTGAVQLWTDTSAFLHVFVAISSCFVIGYVVSILTGGEKKKGAELAGLTLWNRESSAAAKQAGVGGASGPHFADGVAGKNKTFG
jgi:SSS family transporter